MPPRGASGLSGVLLIDKPSGPTSHDVVARIRRLTGERRVGHAGTLDPLATGLLVVLVGPYTRLEPYLSRAVKSYRATIAFGIETDTDDSQGTVTRTADIPSELLNPEFAAELLSGFVGPQLQQPPAYSAIKVGGRTAHKAARAGTPVVMQPRPIEVYHANLVGLEPDPLRWTADFETSKGTYVRALARDIGRRSGSAAHLSALRRTSSGPFDVSQAHTLEQVEAASKSRAIPDLFADPFFGLGLPVIEASGDEVAHGRPFARLGDEAGNVAVSVAGRLAGVYHRDGELLRADVVFPESPGGAA